MVDRVVGFLSTAMSAVLVLVFAFGDSYSSNVRHDSDTVEVFTVEASGKFFGAESEPYQYSRVLLEKEFNKLLAQTSWPKWLWDERDQL